LQVAPMSIATGVLAAVTGKYRGSLWVGWVITTFGMGLLIYLDINTSTVSWIFLNIVGGIGTGILFAAMALAVQASSPAKNQAYAVILFAFFRAFGQTAGVAIGGVVFQNVLKRKLLTYPSLAAKASEYAKDSSSLVEVIKAMPAGQDKQFLLESYMHGLRGIFIMCTALAAVALIASLWAKALPLDSALETDQGFQHKERKSDEEKSPRNSS
jgi:MFS family permease